MNNDLVSKMVFGAMIARQSGIEQSEAMKIGLLSAIDNSKNLAVPMLTAKLRADDQVEIQDLKDKQQMLNDSSRSTRRQLDKLEEEAKALITFIFTVDNDGVPPDNVAIQAHINDDTDELKNFIP